MVTFVIRPKPGEYIEWVERDGHLNEVIARYLVIDPHSPIVDGYPRRDLIRVFCLFHDWPHARMLNHKGGRNCFLHVSDLHDYGEAVHHNFSHFWRIRDEG